MAAAGGVACSLHSGQFAAGVLVAAAGAATAVPVRVDSEGWV